MVRKKQRGKRGISKSLRVQQSRPQIEEAMLILDILVANHLWSDVIDHAQNVLKSFSLEPESRVNVLGSLGTAYVELHDYLQAYKAFSAALSISPEDIYVLYYHNIAAQHTNRFGQAMRDLEIAAEHVEAD